MCESNIRPKTSFPQTSLRIERSSQRGFGVGVVSDREVEVAHTLPGDFVRVELMRAKKKRQKGRLLELIESSHERVEARCRHAFLCGGCTWQTMSYVSQVARKQALLEALFPGTVLPLIPCEEPWRYRNKMEFSFSENRAGTRFLGLMIAHAEPFVFNLEECLIAPPWMAEVVQRVRVWWETRGLQAYQPHQNCGVLRYLTLRGSVRSGERMVILNVSQEWDRKEEEGFCHALGEGFSLFVRVHQAQKGVPTHFEERLLAGNASMIETLLIGGNELRFKISPSSFFQPNVMQAEILYQLALDGLGQEEKLVYDLYCGAGTLSLVASLVAQEVVGIELNPQAVADARENALLNGVSHVRFVAGDVGRVLQGESGKPDAVIVDPPRAGLDSCAVEQIKMLAPKKIIYISCNPHTLAENVREFVQAGYELESVQGVDQFPHTIHVESVARLRRVF